MAKQDEGDVTLAGRIKIAMAAAGIDTPAKLAKKMGVNRQTVYRWVDGEGDKLTPDMLFRLSDALNVNARWLAFGPPLSPAKPTMLDHDTQELIQLRDALPQEGRDQWISQGRALVKLLSPQSAANPFPAKTKK